VLEVSLRKAGFTVTPASSVQDALDKLELHAPDLIISETTFTDGDGFELRRRVRATQEWGDIPFIFLTAEAAIENKIRGLELGVDDYLTKPIYIKEIVTRINILLQKRQRVRFEERKDGRTRFAGRVTDMPVVDVIQTIEISRKSGVIQFVGERGRQAAIYFRDGKVIDAEAGTLQGEDAVYRLLTWSEGEFEVVFRTVRRREVITTSSQGLLMEGMRRLDEWSRLLEQLPPLTHRFEIDTGELAGRLGDVPDDNNRILRLIDGKRTLLEVIDASDFGDLECIQAVARLYFEELLLDLDHDAPKRRDTGKPVPLVEVDAPSPIEDVVSGPHPHQSMETARVSDSSILSEEIAAEVATQVAEATAAEEPAPPQALMGAYRQSSLMLIDAAVAAAQAIEPGLFDDDPANNPPTAAGLDEEDTAQPIDAGVPEEIASDEASEPPRRTKRVSAPPPPDLPPLRREDSGLRMIGSLGRDRAEASGELVPIGATAPGAAPETQRELVTILPRRITREMQAVQPTEPAAEPASARPVEQPPSRPAPPRIVKVGTGVTRADSGPGGAATALIVLAAILAAIAVFLWVKKSRSSSRVVVADASYDAELVAVGETPDAAVEDAPPELVEIDAPFVWGDASVDSAPADAAVAAVTDAAVPPRDAAPVRIDAGVAVDAGVDPNQQARVLMQQAHEANQEGDFAKALALSNSSLKLRRTARAYIVRAQALQRLERIEDALDSIDSAEELAPDYASVYEARGSILWAAGRYAAARRVYERFLELEPDSARANQVRKKIAEPQ
jgi:CheY-like chemotaxis protein